MTDQPQVMWAFSDGIALRDPTHVALFKPGDAVIAAVCPWGTEANNIRHGQVVIESVDTEAGVLRCKGAVMQAIPALTHDDYLKVLRRVPWWKRWWAR